MYEEFRYLNTWLPVGDAVWGLGVGGALLEEACCGALLQFLSPTSSFLCLMCVCKSECSASCPCCYAYYLLLLLPALKDFVIPLERKVKKSSFVFKLLLIMVFYHRNRKQTRTLKLQGSDAKILYVRIAVFLLHRVSPAYGYIML